MSGRAAIYIRRSSDTQGGKSSTGEQEVDCQTLARQEELQVVDVYRDVEKYRVGNRLVEPSGSRSDRRTVQIRERQTSRNTSLGEVV